VKDEWMAQDHIAGFAVGLFRSIHIDRLSDGA
jgi:hypothetical protein